MRLYFMSVIGFHLFILIFYSLVMSIIGNYKYSSESMVKEKKVFMVMEWQFGILERE